MQYIESKNGYFYQITKKGEKKESLKFCMIKR